MVWSLPVGRRKGGRPRRSLATLKRRSGPPSPAAVESLEERTLLSGGILDPSYGNGGVATIPGLVSTFSLTDVALQSDSKAVVVGEGSGAANGFDFVVVRLNTDGSLDNTFGQGGVATADFGGFDQPNAVAIQPNGKIVVVGNTSVSNNFAIARFNADGTLDTTFGKGGEVVTDFNNGIDTARSVAIQPNGDIVVGGISTFDFALARYLPNGNLDTTFGKNGEVTTPVFGSSGGAGLVLANNGQIYLGGSDLTHFVVLRYNSDGSLDSSWGNGGIATTTIAGQSSATLSRIAQQGDGRIVAVGSATGPTGKEFALVRYDTNGTLDPSFGKQGEVQTSFTVSDSATDLIIEPTSQRIVVVGSSATNGTARIARYNTDGSLDTSFGNNGSTNVPTGTPSSAALEQDNKLVVAGAFGVPPSGPVQPATARYFLGNPQGDFNFSTSIYRGREGTSVLVTVERDSGSQGTVSVHYATSDGTATAGIQYAATSGTLTFQPGDTTKTFSVPLLPDGIIDGLTTINLTLSNPTGGATLGDRPTAIINDIDAAGSLQFSDVKFAASASSGSALITVTRAIGDGGPVSVDYKTSDLTAVGGVDYVPTAGTLNFADGQTTATFKVPLLVDLNASGILKVNLSLNNPTGGATLGTPSDAELDVLVSPGDFIFQTAAFGAVKGSLATVTVIRENGSDGAASIDYATSDGTGKAGIDYIPSIGTLNFAAGQTTQTFTVQTLNDGQISGNLGVNLTLSNPTGGASVGGRANAMLVVIDSPGQVQFGAPGFSAQESSAQAIISVVRTQGVGGAISVNYTTNDGTAKAGIDFQGTTGTLNFAPGQPAAFITVPILDDGKTGTGDKVFTITLSAPGGGASLGTQATTSVTVVDNHQPGNPYAFTSTGQPNLAVFRPTTGQFLISGVGISSIGQPGDIPVPGYYDAKSTENSSGVVVPGLKQVEAAVYRPSTGTWLIQGPGGVRTVQFGLPNVDVPVPADFDGDGQTDLAVYRPTTGQWLILNSSLGVQTVTFGTPGLDMPLVGDFDGDGRADEATYRPSTGLWQINEHKGVLSLNFGVKGIDKPVPADFDGDGKTDIALYRQTTGQWIVIYSHGGAAVTAFGAPGLDLPVPFDLNGDGKADFNVYRPSTGQWLSLFSGNGGVAISTFGIPNVDVPAVQPMAFGTFGGSTPFKVSSQGHITAAGAPSLSAMFVPLVAGVDAGVHDSALDSFGNTQKPKKS